MNENINLGRELFNYFIAVYGMSNEREMTGVLRSGMLQKRIAEKLPGEIVSVRRKGKFLHITTQEAPACRVWISEKCIPVIEIC